MGGGYQRLTKIFGAIVLNGKRYVWDYHRNVGVAEEKMPVGSERWMLSEAARHDQEAEARGGGGGK